MFDNFGGVYKAYMIICFVASIVLLRRKSQSFHFGKYKVLLLLLLLIGVLNSLLNISEIQAQYFMPQLMSFCLFALILISDVSKIPISFKNYARKIVWLNIMWNFLLLLMFRAGMFGDPGYPNFDVSGLFITYAYSLYLGSPMVVACHLLVFALAEKRTLLVVAILGLIIIKSKSAINLIGKYPKIFLTLGVMFSTYIVHIFVGAASYDALDMSTLERISEVSSAYTQLMRDWYDVLLGRGFGWAYELVGFTIPYEERELRGFMHFSPAYFHVTFGMVGIFLLVDIFKKVAIYSGSNRIEDRVLGFYAISMILIGFTRLNYFTEPSFIMAISCAYCYSLNSSKS